MAKDVALGNKLRERAALLGYEFASERLAQEAEKTDDLETAHKWYMLASEQGGNIPDYLIRRLERKIKEKRSTT